MRSGSQGFWRILRNGTFCSGWVVERHPGLVKALAEQGHEIASHGYGYGHELVANQTDSEFQTT